MIAEFFLDTNILLYAASKNPAHRSKKTRAIELIEEEQFALSAQVLQEFYVNATKKADFSLTPDVALRWIEKLEEFVCLPVDSGLVKTAAAMSVRYGISYWDGAIVAAAAALGAPVLTPKTSITGRLTARSPRSIHFSISPRNRAFTKTDKQRLQRIRAWPSSSTVTPK